MAVVDGDAVPLEDGVELEDDKGARGFDAVGLVRVVDAVRGELVRVEEGLVGVHGGEVDAVGVDEAGGGFFAGGGVFGFGGAVGGAVDAGDGLDDGGAADSFDEGQEQEFGARDVVFEV